MDGLPRSRSLTGDSYNSGGFSTRTTLIDLASEKFIGDLEEFNVIKDGQPFKKADFNFWGVTFAPDGNRFCATLASGGKIYLVEGNTSTRELRVSREGGIVVLPDGTRLVFKSRSTEGGKFLAPPCLELHRTEYTQRNSQCGRLLEWLDTIMLYGLPRNVAGGTSDIWLLVPMAQAPRACLGTGRFLSLRSPPVRPKIRR
jgi:hypothetical protein